MPNKKKRLAKILEIIENNKIEKQEEIVSHLLDAGFDVTQATVSRDIHNLRLVKVMQDNGVAIYAQSKQTSDDKHNEKLYGIFAHSVTSVVSAGNIVVVKTISGAAQAAASAVDTAGIEEIVGCIAGDDTIMIVVNTADEAKNVCARLNEMRG